MAVLGPLCVRDLCVCLCVRVGKERIGPEIGAAIFNFVSPSPWHGASLYDRYAAVYEYKI